MAADGKIYDRLAKRNRVLAHEMAAMGGRLETSIRMLAAISDLTAVPLEAANLTEASQKILDVMVKEIGDIDRCSILVYRPEEDRLKLLAAKGAVDLLEEYDGPYNRTLEFKPGEGIAGRVFSENTPLFWDPTSQETEALKIDSRLSTPKSLACLPISTSDLRVGVLNISFVAAKSFDLQRKRHLMILGGVVANVIQTFILKEEVHEKNANLLRKITESNMEIDERKKAEDALRAKEKELLHQTNNLEEANIALKVLLKHRDEEKERFESNVLANVKALVMPYMERLKKSRLDPDQRTNVALIESALDEITSPFVRKLNSKLLGLTPTEVKVAALVRDGKTTAEISEILIVSENAISIHRKRIRAKLGLKHKKANLRTHLQHLSQE